MNTYNVFKPEVGCFLFPGDFQLLIFFFIAWVTSSAYIALHGWLSRSLGSSSCFLIHSVASLLDLSFSQISTVQLHQMLAVHPH